MKVNRFELFKKFELLLPAVGFNAMLPEFQRFRISGSTISATDGALQVVTFLNVDLGFSCSVPAKAFFDVLASLKEEEVTIELDRETKNLVLQTPKTKANFASVPYKAIPEINPVGTPWSKETLPGGIPVFLEKLAFCQTCVSNDETAGVWCGVLLDREYVLASDKYRICRSKYINLFEGAVPEPFSIPIKFIDLMKKHADKIDLFGLGDEGQKVFVIFKDGTLISTPVYTGEYQVLDRFFPGEDVEFRVIDPSPEILEAIDRHAIFLNSLTSVDRDITVEYKNQKCIISSEIKQVGSLVETFDTGADWNITFYVNPSFFNDANQKMSIPREGEALGTQCIRYFTDHGHILSIRGADEYLITPRT
jgi:DNA polymerase III sliding clamp (beta) subunit (PCNA family)